MWIVEWIIPAAFAIVNLYAFVLMGVDKRRARRQQWRISEKQLLLTALCFGAPGALIGMKVFHHKTKHNRFRIGIPVMLIIQLIIIFK